jgi:RimJ/RimL family protein N-acetyltransferase
MTTAHLRGERLRLAIFDLEKDSEAFAQWGRDSEYQRLLNSGPSALFSAAATRGFIEKGLGENDLLWSIRLLPEEITIGFISLEGFNWQARSAWVAIGIGDPAHRGKGLGTEAMDVLMRYAFEHLNLNRVNLTVYEFNPRAVRSYEKSGFVHEGRQRQWLNRGGQRWDMLFMGLLREDWLAKNVT